MGNLEMKDSDKPITTEVKGIFVRHRYKKVPRCKSALGLLMNSILVYNLPDSKCKFYRDVCYITANQEDNPILYAIYKERIPNEKWHRDKLCLSFKIPPKSMKDVVDGQIVHLKVKLEFWRHNGLGGHVKLIKIIDISPAPEKEPEKTVQEAVKQTNDIVSKVLKGVDDFLNA